MRSLGLSFCLLVFLFFLSFSQNNWNFEVIFKATETSPWNLESSLEWSVDLEGVKLVTRSVFGTDGFEDLVFTGEFTVDIWGFYGELSFSPSMPDVFDHLSTTTSLDLPGLSTEMTMYLSSASDSYYEIQFRSSLGSTEIKLTNRFAGLKPQYESTEVSVSAGQVLCVKDLSFCIDFAKTGFQELKISLKDVPLLGMEFPTFDISADFTLTHKDITLEVSSEQWEASPCVKVYWGIEIFGSSISQLALNGIEVTCPLGPFQFRSVTALNPSSALSLLDVYKEGYWEMLELSVDIPLNCCNRSIEVTFASYFSKNSEWLFGWAETVISLGWHSQSLSGEAKLELAGQGLEELSVGLKLSWGKM